jgi:hypothetical protein
MKMLVIIMALVATATSLASCAPLVIGGIAGVAVYRHECYRWIETPQGQQRVWICHGRP